MPLLIQLIPKTHKKDIEMKFQLGQRDYAKLAAELTTFSASARTSSGPRTTGGRTSTPTRQRTCPTWERAAGRLKAARAKARARKAKAKVKASGEASPLSLHRRLRRPRPLLQVVSRRRRRGTATGATSRATSSVTAKPSWRDSPSSRGLTARLAVLSKAKEKLATIGKKSKIYLKRR